MFISKKALPRRTFLRGIGTALSLPLLDAMVPSMTALAATPAAPNQLRRLGYVYMPMGCDMSRWAFQSQMYFLGAKFRLHQALDREPGLVVLDLKDL